MKTGVCRHTHKELHSITQSLELREYKHKMTLGCKQKKSNTLCFELDTSELVELHHCFSVQTKSILTKNHLITEEHFDEDKVGGKV